MSHELIDKNPIFRSYENAYVDWISTSVDAIVVLNKWYTPLETVKGFRGLYLLVEQTNDGAAVEDIEVEITPADGTPVVKSETLNSGDVYYYFWVYDGSLNEAGANNIRQMGSLDTDQSGPYFTRSCKIRVRQTTAVDAVAAQIEVNCTYARLMGAI